MLTESKIRKLAPRAAPYRVSDGMVPGLHVQVSPNGNRSFTLAYRDAKRQRKFWKIGEVGVISLIEARTRAGKVRDDVSRGIDPRAAQEEKRRLAALPSPGTVAELFAGYIADRKRAGVRSASDIESYFNSLVLPHLDGKTLAKDVTSGQITAVLRVLCEREKISMAVHLRSYLRAAFRWAASVGNDPMVASDNRFNFEMGANPVDDTKTPTGGKRARERFLSVEELGQVWEAAPKWAQKPALLAIRAVIASAGCRVEEVLNLHWSQVDLIEGVIHWDSTKMGKRQVRPIGRHLRRVLKQAQDEFPNSDVVFPGQYNALSTPMKAQTLAKMVRRIVNKEDMEHWVPKDIRRTAITLLAKEGVHPDVLERLLNHAKTSTMDVHYNHHRYLPELREATSVWDGVIDRATGEEPYLRAVG